MDKVILEKMEQKIQETVSKRDEIRELVRALSVIDDSESFAMGIVTGRVYNSFYYQTKRILNREPSKSEFDEFLEMIRTRDELRDLW